MDRSVPEAVGGAARPLRRRASRKNRRRAPGARRPLQRRSASRSSARTRRPVEDVWDLWTTKEGIESWWGPDGFSRRRCSDRPPPEREAPLRWMTATGAEQIDFMKKNGMPLTNHTRGWYDEIVAPSRLLFCADRGLRSWRRRVRHRDARRAVSGPPRASGSCLRSTPCTTESALDPDGQDGLGGPARQAGRGARGQRRK